MKKIFIGATALTLSVVLVGCGGSGNNAAITNLSNQLDDTANTVSSVQTVNPTDLNMTKSMLDTIASKDNSEAIYDNVIVTQQSLLGEEYYKMDILNKTATLKNKLSKDLKLSKAQTNAVKELTNSLSKYTNSVEYTKNEMNSTVKSISSLKKNVDKNSDKINAKLNRLSCNSNTRSAYYENILNTLNEIGKYLNCEETQQPNTALNEQNKNEMTYENERNKNIDTYLPENQQNVNEQQDENCQNCPSQNQLPYNANNFNRLPYNSNNFNRMNGGFYGNYAGYPAYPAGYGAYGNNPMGYNGFGAYGFGNGFYGRFNPTRNTDSYAPLTRNIDTYMLPSNPQTSMPPQAIAPVTLPEQRLENFEKVNEDGSVEKLDEEECECEEETSQSTPTSITTIQNLTNEELEELNHPTVAH